jgi:hypothetical protein
MKTNESIAQAIADLTKEQAARPSDFNVHILNRLTQASTLVEERDRAFAKVDAQAEAKPKKTTKTK